MLVDLYRNDLIILLSPIDTFIMGDDWAGKFDFLEDESVEAVYLLRTPEISTTQIKTDLHTCYTLFQKEKYAYVLYR